MSENKRRFRLMLQEVTDALAPNSPYVSVDVETPAIIGNLETDGVFLEALILLIERLDKPAQAPARWDEGP